MKRKGKGMGNKFIYGVLVAVILGVIALLQGAGILPENVNVPSEEVYFHVIDVGQGSSCLVQKGTSGILIDGGERDYGGTVCDYLKNCGITELEYVIASHPHSDHIGGLITVLDEFKVKNVLMPELSEKNIPTTRIYEKFLDAIEKNGAEASYCEVGDIYALKGAVTVDILGPIEQVDDLNNMSAICKVTYGETDIMVLGDAEKRELSSVYNTNANFESEIILMGHHGSRTSLHKEFLEAVNPETAVISCGLNNSYNHPHEEALNYLESEGIEYYRTDVSGDIVFKLDVYSYEKVEK